MTPRDPAVDLPAMLTAIGHADDAERPGGRDREVDEAVAEWAEAFEPMSGVAQPVPVPPHLWPRIEASVRAEMRGAAAGSEERSWLADRLWNSLNVWRLATAVAATAVVLLAVFGRGPATTGPAYVAVLQAPDGDRRAGFVVEVSAAGEVTLTPLGATVAGADKSLQFWTLADKAKGPQSLGLVPGDRPTRVPAEKLPSIAAGQLFEVTLEPYGGSPIGRPTGPILFKGLTSATAS